MQASVRGHLHEFHVGAPAPGEEPLEYLRSDTYRQRQVGAILERLLNGEAAREEVLTACEFLAVELPLHLIDVSNDLATMLSERCKPSDNIASLLEEFGAAQKLVKQLSLKMHHALLRHIERDPARDPTKSTLSLARNLLTALRRLSALESGIIFPLARVRLDKEALAELDRRIRQRRGIVMEG